MLLLRLCENCWCAPLLLPLSSLCTSRACPAVSVFHSRRSCVGGGVASPLSLCLRLTRRLEMPCCETLVQS
jgi:hypothetical protein